MSLRRAPLLITRRCPCLRAFPLLRPSRPGAGTTVLASWVPAVSPPPFSPGPCAGFLSHHRNEVKHRNPFCLVCVCDGSPLALPFLESGFCCSLGLSDTKGLGPLLASGWDLSQPWKALGREVGGSAWECLQAWGSQGCLPIFRPPQELSACLPCLGGHFPQPQAPCPSVPHGAGM